MALLLAEEFGGSLSGSLLVSDSGSKIGAPIGGRRRFSGGLGSPVWGDPGFRYGTVTRSTLGPVTALVRLTNQPGSGPALVIQDSATLDVNNGIRVLELNYEIRAGIATPGATRRRSIDYLLTAIPRVGGGYFLMLSGGAYGVFPVATLVDVTAAGNGASVYVFLAGHSATWDADWLHIHDSADLPSSMATRFGASLAGDDFTGTNGTNINGRTALGAQGAAWAVNAGTATIQANALSLNTSGSASVNVGSRPRIVEATLTRVDSGSRPMILFRGDGTTSGSWRCKAEFDRISLQIPGGGTVAQTGAITFTEDVAYTVKVVDTGSRIRCFVNGTEYLQWDATGQNTATRCGVACENGNGIAEDFSCWADQISLPGTLESFPAPPAGTGAAVVAETFPGANGSALPAGWTVDAGTWRQQSGKAEMTTAGVSGAASVATGSAGADHEIKADITLPSTNPVYPPNDWAPGVRVRQVDVSNFVEARFLRQGSTASPSDTSNEVEMWEYTGGTGVIINYINLGVDAIATSSTHTLAIAALAEEVAAYLDGELVVQAETTVLTGSRAGIGVRDNNPSGQPAWDNVEVRATGASLSGPVISNVQVVWRRSTTALITWTTDRPARGRVDHGATSAYGSSTTLSGLTTSHSHTVSGITPGATWHYSVYSEVD